MPTENLIIKIQLQTCRATQWLGGLRAVYRSEYLPFYVLVGVVGVTVAVLVVKAWIRVMMPRWRAF